MGLTPEQETIITATLCPPHDNTLLIEKYAIPITRKVISCFRPEKWLNDEVINFYMELLQERDFLLCKVASERGCTRLPSHIFNLFFMSKLLENNIYAYQNVMRCGCYIMYSILVNIIYESYRWTKKINIFDFDKILFPVNIGNTHWTLVVAYMRSKRIQYLDSLRGNGKKYTSAVKRYIIDEMKDKQNVVMSQDDVNAWVEAPMTPDGTPVQNNGYDCGVFVCMYADYILENHPFSFSQANIPMLRRKLCLCIAYRI